MPPSVPLFAALKITVLFKPGFQLLLGTLDGWKLFHDPNLTANVSSGTSEIKPTEGNFNRDLWKRVALRMTQVNISPCQHEFDERKFQNEAKFLHQT